MPGARLLRPLVHGGLLASLAVAAAAAEADAASTTVRVGTDTQLAAAVQRLGRSGGTVVLRPGSYGRLRVSVTPARPLRIVGPREARIERVVFDGAARVSLAGVTIRPVSKDAWIEVWRSWRIDLRNLLVTARGTRFAAGIVLADAHLTRIRGSRFTHCGDHAPQMVNCVTLYRWSSHLTIQGNRFHDCYGCDFVNGKFRSHLTIRGNRFDRALPCAMGGFRCGHQDLVQLFGGHRLRVERNRFGVYRSGGAQLYLTNAMNHALIRNNVFLGRDRRVPGYRPRVGLVLGSRESRRVPLYARIVNNTFQSGVRRTDGYAGSLRMSSRYGSLRRRLRPVLANNVIRLLESTWPVCAAVRASVGNVVERGEGCSFDDNVGTAALDRSGRPTRASGLVVDVAYPGLAPRRDITGRRRDRRPDVGAYEYRPSAGRE